MNARSSGKRTARQRLRVSPDPGGHVFSHGSWVFQRPKVSEAASLDERTQGERIGNRRSEGTRPRIGRGSDDHGHRCLKCRGVAPRPARRGVTKDLGFNGRPAPQRDRAVRRGREAALDIGPESIGVELVERWLRPIVLVGVLQRVEAVATPGRPARHGVVAIGQGAVLRRDDDWLVEPQRPKCSGSSRRSQNERRSTHGVPDPVQRSLRETVGCSGRPAGRLPCPTTPIPPPAATRTCHGLSSRSTHIETDRSRTTPLAPRPDRETPWRARRAAREWRSRHSVRPDHAGRSERRHSIGSPHAYALSWRGEDYLPFVGLEEARCSTKVCPPPSPELVDHGTWACCDKAGGATGSSPRGQKRYWRMMT